MHLFMVHFGSKLFGLVTKIDLSIVRQVQYCRFLGASLDDPYEATEHALLLLLPVTAYQLGKVEQPWRDKEVATDVGAHSPETKRAGCLRPFFFFVWFPGQIHEIIPFP
jgi:hypothetical protein